MKLVVFSDASLGNMPNGGSQGGYFVLLVGESGKTVLAWHRGKTLCSVCEKKEAMYTEIFTCTGLQHYSIFSVRDRVQSLRKWVSQETRANLEVLSEQFL